MILEDTRHRPRLFARAPKERDVAWPKEAECQLLAETRRLRTLSLSVQVAFRNSGSEYRNHRYSIFQRPPQEGNLQVGSLP